MATRDTRTRAQKVRAVKQEETRAKLRALGLIQHVTDLAEKIEDPECPNVAALKASADIRLALIKKYLPDLKAAELEITGAGGGPVEWSVLPVASDKGSGEASPDTDDPEAG